MELVWAALGAVNPARAVARCLRREGEALIIGDRPYDLTALDRVVVIGAGKASAGMAAAVEAFLGDRIATGWVNVRYGYEPPHRWRASTSIPQVIPSPTTPAWKGRGKSWPWWIP
jgi:hydroxypyruvate reductase